MLKNIANEQKNIASERWYNVIDDLKVGCVLCQKIIYITYATKHLNTCKGVPYTCCMYCRNEFRTPSVKCRHQKICKLNPVNMPQPPPSSVDQPQTVNNMNITNNINNVCLDNSVVNNNNLTLNFGNENISCLLQSEDSRIKQALTDFTDTLKLIFFNKDHPENQTVRKLNKKSNLMEFRSNDRWEPECCTTGIPKMQTSMSTLLEKPITVFKSTPTFASCKEIVYHLSKVDGGVVQDDILIKYPHDESVEKEQHVLCRDACVRYFLNLQVSLLRNVSVHECIRKELNAIRATYGEDAVGKEECLKEWIIPTYRKKTTMTNG